MEKIKPLLLNIQSAASFLGVNTSTIRQWARSNKLKGVKVGSRGDWRFKEEELLKMLADQEIPISEESLISPQFQYSSGEIPGNAPNYAILNNLERISKSNHLVRFYEDDVFIIKSIYDFIKQGDAGIVIATKPHIKLLEELLMKENLNGKDTSDQYILLDAEVTLAKFMLGDMPDPKLFDQVIGELIADVLKNSTRVQAYGEMVAILWSQGNIKAALELEKIWNNLQKTYTFNLYCAYPLKDLRGSDFETAFKEVCSTHSDVLPGESYGSLGDTDAKLRAIAAWQQKAESLQMEIDKRKDIESRLLKTMDALRTSEEFNRGVIESSADCIKVIDLNGRLVSMNIQGQSVMEIDNFDEFKGSNWLLFWKGEYHKLALKAFKTAKKGGIGRFQGYSPTAKGNVKWWDVVVTPIFNNQGAVDRLVSVSRDITQIKDLEIRKDDFISATSHELKTPLTSQKGYIQLLERMVAGSPDPKLQKYISKVGEQTDKLTKLVSNLLDASKIQEGKLAINVQKFTLMDLLQDVKEEMQLSIKSHKFEIKGNTKIKVSADKDRIYQVLTNLITNAAKYSPNAGKITIKTKLGKMSVTISVRDYGIGINKNHQGKVFDRFFRVYGNDESTYPGLGMGLFISKEIIEKHQGKIWLESKKDKGSTFFFTLPVSVS